MANVLVVDDVSGMRAALTEGLSQEGMHFDMAEDGQVAIQLLGQKSYDLVISDLQMPNVDGVELLKWIKSHKPKTKVILITAFSHILETQEAILLGADDFLPKPVRLNELTTSVQKLIGDAISLGQNLIESEYCQIDIEDLIQYTTLPYSLYLRVSPNKFIQVAERGDVISVATVEHYKKKGVNIVYCKIADFDALNS